MKAIRIITGLILVAAMVMLYSCDKRNETASGSFYSVRMTDAPGPYSQVNIDIQSVQLLGSHGQSVTLSVHSGIYNLLDLSDGLDTLLAWGNVPFEVEQVHITLGTNNTLVVDGQTFPILIPAAEATGLTFPVHQVSMGANTIILIDFDANQSIVAEGNGHFHCRPVIRWIDYYAHTHGEIRGRISPHQIFALVTAEGAGNTFFSTAVNGGGNFKLRGLPAGTYSVVVTPAPPLMPVTIPNVTVTADEHNDIGTITLQ